MLITINAVNITRAPKGYSIAEVKYLREGKPEERKVMSFVNEGVFKTLEGFKTFPIEANIRLAKELNKKDGKEYWQWKDIEVGNTSGTTQTATSEGPKTAGKVIGSNYETSAERARRQVYIVRQSSISSALGYLAAKEPKGTTATIQDVIALAKELESFVMDVGSPDEVPL